MHHVWFDKPSKVNRCLAWTAGGNHVDFVVGLTSIGKPFGNCLAGLQACFAGTYLAQTKGKPENVHTEQPCASRSSVILAFSSQIMSDVVSTISSSPKPFQERFRLNKEREREPKGLVAPGEIICVRISRSWTIINLCVLSFLSCRNRNSNR